MSLPHWVTPTLVTPLILLHRPCRPLGSQSASAFSPAEKES